MKLTLSIIFLFILSGCVTPNKGWAVQGKIKVVPEIVNKSVNANVLITSSRNEFTYFEVLDSTYQVIRPAQIFQKIVVFDTSLYEPGIYYVKVVNKIVKFKIVL